MDTTAEKKLKITLVGLRQAKKGFTFLHEGQLDECTGCELFKICMAALEPGRVYRVDAVRDKVFSCKVHEEGVRVVEVVEPDIEAAIDERLVFPGGIVPYQPQECVAVSCVSYEKCVPHGLKKGDKCRVLEVVGQVKCPLGRSLALVKMRLQRD